MAGMDDQFRKQIRPVDYHGSAGTMARGNNVYKGGSPNATSGPLKRRTLQYQGQGTPVNKKMPVLERYFQNLRGDTGGNRLG